MRVYDFLLSVASQLGDGNPTRPFRRYPLADLVTFYGEAMCFVASHRPDLFTDFKVMKLVPGAYQDARCCGCHNVIGVVAQVDKDGNTVKDLSSAGSINTKVSRQFRAPCRTTADGTATPTVSSVSIEPGMNGVFSVDPPVPVGVDMWVKVKCVGTPNQPTLAATLSTATTTGCSFLPAVRSYVLYRALMGDRHAVGAFNESQAELKNAYTYLGIQIKAEDRQESE